jgi:hypothetical protein
LSFRSRCNLLVRDYDPELNKDNVLARMLEHKEAIISHLSWASLFLGFHTLGLYIHNDTVVAFGQPENKFYLNLYLLSTFKQLQVKQFMNLMFYYQIQLVQQQ